jgi:hypothetical protein
VKIEPCKNSGFTPFKIVIETPQDAVKMFALFRSNRVISTLNMTHMADDCRESMKELMPNIIAESDEDFAKLQNILFF